MRHRKKKDRSRLWTQLHRIYRWSAPMLGAMAVAAIRWLLEVAHRP
ncbi:hypothetical protein ACGFLS_30890 [Streptomyces abikoensis]